MKRTPKLGERRMIEIMQSYLDLMPKVPIPFGDDVSAVSIGKRTIAVLKTDMLVSKTDMPPDMTLWQAARKAVVMNISDFAAKGVKPKALLVSLGLPKGIDEDSIRQLAQGLNAGAREYGAYVIGGDMGEASDLVISISLFGTSERRKVMLRSGAKPGDLLAVTGCFGKSSAGLLIVMQKIRTSEHLRKDLVESVMLPHARLNEGLALMRTAAVSAAIDSSDGLAWSLHEIARASNVGFMIDKLPLSSTVVKFAEGVKLDPVNLALYGGEEYEIVLTVKPRLWEVAEKAVSRVGGRLIRIGVATLEKGVFLTENGKKQAIKPRGYEHFKDI